MVAGDALRERLLAVEGVADADVEGAIDSPAGVRVVLANDADADEVGRRVQEILAKHGIRARLGGQQRNDGPPPPPGAPAEVVTLRGSARSAGIPDVPPTADVEVDLLEAGVLAGTGVAPGVGVVTGATLEALAVEETREGLIVTASAADGRSASRRARWSEGGLHEAVVSAVADLASPVGPPLLLKVVESQVAGSAVMTVVVERVDGRRVAGAAVVEAGAAFAVAKAAWQALTEG